MGTRTEEYWERRKLEEERSAARRRRENPDHPLGYARRLKAKGQPCRVCALRGRRNPYDIEAHHIVHRGRIGGRHPLVHHPDNILPVCHAHHQDHHNTARRIPWAALTAEERAFAIQHGGEGWIEKWYPKDDTDESRPD